MPNHPDNALLLTAPLVLASQDGEASKETESAALRHFHGVAYSGSELFQGWADGTPIYLDLSSIKFRQQVPLMVDHEYDVDHRVGLCDAKVVDGRLEIDGVIDASTPRGADLAARGEKIPWQLSVGAAPGAIRKVKADEAAEINGHEITGPALICVGYTLQEVSICAIGADACTSLNIQACFSPSSHKPTNTEDTKMPETIQASQTVPAANAAIADGEKKSILAAEKARISEILKLTRNYPEIQARAIDENWTGDQTARKVLETIQAATPAAQFNVNRNETIQADEPEMGVNTLRAAMMQTAGVAEQSILAECGEKAMDEARKSFRGGMGVQELLLRAAKQSGADFGYKATMGNVGAILKAAAASTIDVGGILGGVIDRRLAEGFTAEDQSWREVAEIISVKDFRAIETYQLISGGSFQKVTDGGELKNGTLTHSERANQADLYGEILTLTLKDIINDDLNAFSRIPFLLGQDAAVAFNEVFWKEFLDNTGFFTAGDGNLVTSAPFGVDGLGSALAAFRSLRDEGGHRIGGQPVKVLVPPELEAKAASLYQSTEVRETGTTAKAYSTANPFVGKFKPVVAPYLSDSNLDGYSATSWYLLGDPSRRAPMQAAFLNGQQAPTIERGVPAFSQLGISFRAYQAFGCVKNVKQSGVRCNA